MVRIRRLATALVAFASLATALAGHAARVPAQALQRLTVQAFTLGADTANPQAGTPFHLVVTLRVREHVTQIDNLELPLLADLDLLGDERRLQSGPGGTLYRESITVVARQAGTIAIGPAVLQAIDARDRRPKQYFTNRVTLHVSGNAAPVAPSGDAVAGFALLVLRVMLWIGGALCAVVVIAFIFRRRPAAPMPAVPAPVVPAPVPVVQRSPRDELRDALVVLRAERTRTTAVRVRALVWRMVGASEGETLADVLQRPEATSPPMRELLRALERAAFTYDDDLTPAIDDACATLERYLG
ncbi:MAG: hypothetical protein WB615_14935 [Candidatus Tumulicola sp.]